MSERSALAVVPAGGRAAPPKAADGAEASLRHYLEPIAPLLAIEGVTDLVVNRPGEVGVEVAGQWQWHKEARLTLPYLESLARQLAHYNRQDIKAEWPLCSAVMPGGERIQIVMAPAVLPERISLTIRKPPSRILATEELEDLGLFAETRPARPGLSPLRERLLKLHAAGQWREFLEDAVKARLNIVISGATGSGKTTLARALLNRIPEHERVVTGEDTHELEGLKLRNLVHMIYPKDAAQAQSKVRPKELMEAALRMRPDRVIFPELRDGAAYYFLRSVASGHPGVITTIHANSCAMAWETLTLLVRESEGAGDLDRQDIKGLLRQTVDVVVQTKRVGSRYQVVEIEYAPDAA